MSDRWDFYFHAIGENRASTFVDLGIHPDVPDNRRPYLLCVRLQMQLPREDGLSSSDEHEILRQLEVGFTAQLERSSRAVYVGRTTGAGYRAFCFYSPRMIEPPP